jgi:hypothetical protein
MATMEYMTDYETFPEELDTALIGPLSPSRIGTQPISWGGVHGFVLADEEVQEYVEREFERHQRAAWQAWKDELRWLLDDVREGREPSTVLHAILHWGPLDIERLAGYLGKTVRDVRRRAEELELLGVLNSAPEPASGSLRYEVDLSSDFFS